MGQTLTHGVYLPDEGERNCYSGLAANWQILDSSVGTIAAHTAALSGKAPLVHTHTKADITDFPVYGTTAGTICEGNDSRLSDARTPVAHTHTKSDVTDLLNSNFIPSANNAYDLGSSSYQWNNLYAKNYYYNGTAWGLDKVNVWSNDQVLEGTNTARILRLRRTDIVMGDPPPASGFIELGSYLFSDKNNANFGFMNLRDYANGHTSLTLVCRQRYTDGVRDTSGANKEASVVLEVDSSTNPNFYPGANGTHNLGTSTNKWKTLNGINPGALSLPRSASVNIDTTNWNLRGGTICAITAPVDTYICVQIRRNVKFDLWVIGTGRQTTTAVKTSNDGYYRAMIMIPCAAGNVMSFYTQPLVDTPEEDRDPDLAIDYAKYFYCLGNV